jgi:hypothetical protein
MSRRKQEEMQFGSDSFLDVIANIVGILIILIVIAGVRVSQQAEAPETESVAEPTPAKPILANAKPNYVPPLPLPPLLPATPEPAPIVTEASPLDPSTIAAILAASEPEKVLPPPRPKPKPRPVMPGYVPKTPKSIPPSPELISAIAGFKTELNTFNEQKKQADRNQQQLLGWNRELSEQIASARKTLQHGWDDSTEQKRQLLELKRSLERTKLDFIGKQQELSEAEKQQTPKDLLRHRLTPVSRVVEKNELHFQVKDNRVAYVPLMELVERMRPQIQRQREWLLKYHEHRGRVGPYRGFLLDYLVVRQRMSAIEETRDGGGARVLPVLLTFEPQEDLTREALDQALRPGSVFIRELQMADVNSTLTFWVYPESFGTYRQLKEFAHAEGFSVAARPLQVGDTIKASPWGNKSDGQ